VNLFRKKKYVHCPVCIGKRKYHALMFSTQIYKVKSLSQQHLTGFQTKAICFTVAWAVSGALSLYSCKILDHHHHLPTGAGHRLNTRETDVLAPLLKHRRRWKTWVEGGGCGSAVLGKLRLSRQGATILGSLTLLTQQARQDSLPVCSSKNYSLSVSLHRWMQKKVSIYHTNFERMCRFIAQKKFFSKFL